MRKHHEGTITKGLSRRDYHEGIITVRTETDCQCGNYDRKLVSTDGVQDMQI